MVSRISVAKKVPERKCDRRVATHFWPLRGQQTNSRVVKLSSNRETPTYAAVLLQDEAIHHDCHQVGTCKVTWDNHRVRIQCRSGKCAKIHSYVTDDESKMCAHAKKYWSTSEISNQISWKALLFTLPAKPQQQSVSPLMLQGDVGSLTNIVPPAISLSFQVQRRLFGFRNEPL